LRDGVSDETRWSIVTAAAVGAAAGGRILYWFEDPRLTVAHWHDPAYLLSGKTIVGALVAGLFAVEWTKKLINERKSTGDLFAAPIALGISIGRIGCFFTGLSDDTFGSATTLPLGVDFGDGVHRHPTQLYESIFALGLFFFLLRMMKRPHRNGDVFKVFMVGYMSWRLTIDFLKPEIRILGFSSIQWACLAMLVYYRRDLWRWVFVREASNRTAQIDRPNNDVASDVTII
jgi:prolipoprotein diacylglyceryltransferase